MTKVDLQARLGELQMQLDTCKEGAETLIIEGQISMLEEWMKHEEKQFKTRPEFDQVDVMACINDLQEKIDFRLKQNGKGIFMTSHEILGIIKEEMNEFESEVQANTKKKAKAELLDIAVGCILGMASYRSEKMDWPK